MVAHALARSTRLLPSLAHLLLVAGCSCSCSGGEPDAKDSAPRADTETSPAADNAQGAEKGGRGKRQDLVATTTEPNAETDTGALQGVLHFEGTPPERTPTGAASSPECKHHPEVDQLRNLVLVKDGKLANVFVTLKSGVDTSKVPPAPTTPVELDQKGCVYLPRVVGLRVGQTLTVRNSDPTAHNVNLKAQRNKSSNRSMGLGQKPLEFVFDTRELDILVKCDIHPWMGAQVHAETHPWFAVSDADGRVRIAGIPPGKYTVEARHEEFGTLAGELTVKAGETTGFEGTFKSK
ncbi:MAG: carboxypeptidase regulatory-like domain-containing protein [Planctomycetota bacterium]